MKKIGMVGCAAVSALAMIGAASAAGNRPVGVMSKGYAQRVVTGAPKSVILYDQNFGDAGVAVSSQNYGVGLDMFDDQAADDFMLPPGLIWKIKEIDVTGNGGCCATSENVYIFADNMGRPGALLIQCMNLVGTDNMRSFAIRLRKPCRVKLGEGRYWVSVQANQDNGQWAWEVRAPIVGWDAAWQNPPGGYGFCQTWGSLGACWGWPGDLMFTLKGKAVPKT